jgi:hypothetical protein
LTGGFTFNACGAALMGLASNGSALTLPA